MPTLTHTTVCNLQSLSTWNEGLLVCVVCKQWLGLEVALLAQTLSVTAHYFSWKLVIETETESQMMTQTCWMCICILCFSTFCYCIHSCTKIVHIFIIYKMLLIFFTQHFFTIMTFILTIWSQLSSPLYIWLKLKNHYNYYKQWFWFLKVYLYFLVSIIIVFVCIFSVFIWIIQNL